MHPNTAMMMIMPMPLPELCSAGEKKPSKPSRTASACPIAATAVPCLPRMVWPLIPRHHRTAAWTVISSPTLGWPRRRVLINLIVRVAGFSAYFVDLSKGLQDHIIVRTEQNL